jgi:hypothetical protein
MSEINKKTKKQVLTVIGFFLLALVVSAAMFFLGLALDKPEAALERTATTLQRTEAALERTTVDFERTDIVLPRTTVALAWSLFQ